MANDDEISRLANEVEKGPVITRIRGRLEMDRPYRMTGQNGRHKITVIQNERVDGEDWTVVLVTKPDRVRRSHPDRHDRGFDLGDVVEVSD